MYWINHTTKQTFWDPLPADQGNHLPPGWESRIDPSSGQTYYIDHNTGTTHWQLPTGFHGSTTNGGIVIQGGILLYL